MGSGVELIDYQFRKRLFSLFRMLMGNRGVELIDYRIRKRLRQHVDTEIQVILYDHLNLEAVMSTLVQKSSSSFPREAWQQRLSFENAEPNLRVKRMYLN